MSVFTADAVSSLFEPDVVLPSQFNERTTRGISGGERKLMAALLSDGIEAYVAQQTAVESHSKLQNEVSEWVETKDLSYVFSFDVVCECLGINPDYLRLGLMRYVESVRLAKREGKGPRRAWKKIRRPRKN
ncbi:MAG: hypothetical protein KDD66_10680 [Bdellovibrionales bacterium]|nr:hypothetical protein [Bdellovibrionales bacterium]